MGPQRKSPLLQRSHVMRAIPKEKSSAWLKVLPSKDISSYGFVRATRKHDDRLRSCLAFFGVASPDEWEDWYKKLWKTFRLEHRQASNRRSELCQLGFARVNLRLHSCHAIPGMRISSIIFFPTFEHWQKRNHSRIFSLGFVNCAPPLMSPSWSFVLQLEAAQVAQRVLFHLRKP